MVTLALNTVRLVFTDDNGCPIRRSTRTRIWKRISEGADRLLQAAGSSVRVPEKLTLHGVRDFYASGHSKPSITLDKYTGLWPAAEDATAAAIRKALEALPPLTLPKQCAPVVPSSPDTRTPVAA